MLWNSVANSIILSGTSNLHFILKRYYTVYLLLTLKLRLIYYSLQNKIELFNGFIYLIQIMIGVSADGDGNDGDSTNGNSGGTNGEGRNTMRDTMRDTGDQDGRKRRRSRNRSRNRRRSRSRGRRSRSPSIRCNYRDDIICNDEEECQLDSTTAATTATDATSSATDATTMSTTDTTPILP